MPNATGFESFERELNRLVESFGKRLAELKGSNQQIDALVYELYGLTDEEIKLVEGGQ